ncbi:MAG: DUF2878 domain-containing protein [Phycisphaerales bacterium]|nr:DUF2878 domain-containing protein [Phycisphaerales bacterium]MCB9858573.1 DUF2878 domain-containing protein [Phycisphaerales bacterium]
MNRKGRLILNIVGLQAGWFICVASGAAGDAKLAAAFVTVHIVVHLALSSARLRDGIVILSTGLVGIGADAAMLRAGAIAFDSGVIGGWLIPIWMIALWVNFSTSLNLTLEFLQSRTILAAVLGGVGGATAYVGGVKFGALHMPWGLWKGGCAVALEWAIVTPVLAWIAMRADRRWARSRREAQSADIAVA